MAHQTSTTISTAAVAAAAELAARHFSNANLWMRAGDALDAAGNRGGAANSYRRAESCRKWAQDALDSAREPERDDWSAKRTAPEPTRAPRDVWQRAMDQRHSW